MDGLLDGRWCATYAAVVVILRHELSDILLHIPRLIRGTTYLQRGALAPYIRNRGYISFLTLPKGISPT